MGKTIVEKIFSSHSNKPLTAGQVGICNVDFCFSQDGTTSLVIDSLNKFKKTRLKNLKSFAMFIDHSAPSPNLGVSAVHQSMRKFSLKHKNLLYDVGCGISHQLMLEEGFVLPGRLILGADSHTATGGILGACCVAVGSTDLAVGLVYKKNWFKVPETIKIIIKGKIPRGVFSKDIALEIVRKFTAKGATYKALEYEGEVIKALSLDARATLTNMSIEFGAKTAIIAPDKKVFAFLNKITKKKINPVYSDEDACYEQICEIDVTKLSPMVAKPHSVDSGVAVSEIEGLKVDQGFIGTCTNGRLEDLEIAAKILNKRKVHKETKLFIAPASKKILESAYKKGILKVFIDSGAIVLPVGCGPCVGTHQGIPADAEVTISTANRNFKGRMGNPNAFIYLASPATVAASCIRSKITDPRNFIKN
ncbi:MAG: 3-isopropylmalate dehydratase large subunit [Candidatus Omnitrophica bacterium]|nr:3-isopropylmalate dehydratase large subunit [Candidatus Omnitrophota bacterium]